MAKTYLNEENMRDIIWGATLMGGGGSLCSSTAQSSNAPHFRKFAIGISPIGRVCDAHPVQPRQGCSPQRQPAP